MCVEAPHVQGCVVMRGMAMHDGLQDFKKTVESHPLRV